MRYLKPILVTLAVIGLAFFAQAQPRPCTEEEVRALLKEDPSRMSNYHHCYEIPSISDTRAPKGYKPFYISHYGRHGERYHTSIRNYDRQIAPLEAMDSAGILTAKGKNLLEDLRFLRRETDRMDGILTRKGAMTHQGIATRMYKRYPEVFVQKARDSVFCASTAVHRCILSMGNFSLALNNFAPNLKFSINAGLRYTDYLCNPASEMSRGDAFEEWRKTVLANEFPVKSMMEELVTDISEAEKYCGDPGLFCYYIINALDITQCLDGPQPDISKYIPREAVFPFWKIANVRFALGNANTAENGDKRPREVGGPILRDVVMRADKAIAGNAVCADFRFGHDTGIMPLVSLLDLNGLGSEISIYNSPWSFPIFNVIPMGANIQMVFYRNRHGDVLVKLLLNEVESTIPVLADVAVNGVYYPWESLRAYFIAKL